MKQNIDAHYKMMTETPIPKLITKLGIPTILTMLITNVYNMVDTFFVGQLGTSASGAVGIVFGLMAMLQAFAFMFGHGAGSIVGRRLGQKDVKGASVFASTGFFLSVIFGVIILALGLCFMTPLVRLLGSTDTILPYASHYAFYILLAAPFIISSFMMNNVLRCEGKAMLGMVGMAAGAVLNMVGDPILMFVFHMGIDGAGLSTALSQVVGFIILLS
jgi:Na+-driven multidrug efflux pump